MNIQERNKHLGKYFDKAILGELDEAVKNVLYEEFANSELRLLVGQTAEQVTAHASRNLNVEYERRLSHIHAEEYEQLKPWYLSIAKSVYEIICSKCGVLLGLEVDTDDDKINLHHHEGKFVVAVGDKMYAYRPRLDGVMGYQCANIVKSDNYDDWVKYEEDLDKFTTKKHKLSDKYEKDLAAYTKLSEKSQAKKQPPTIEDLEAPKVPEGSKYEPCGNDTRVSDIETKVVSEEHLMTSTTKEDIVKVKQEMDRTEYEPDVKKTKQGFTVETFELREVN